jgi:PAS domain S-box-containing protein
MTPTPLNVLLLEDRLADALLVVHTLRQSGFAPQWKQVMTEAEYCAALDEQPELILADDALPQFDALRALDRLNERGLDIPFIIVSGTIGEETAISALQRGAADYLLKDRLTRLGMAVRAALQRSELRAEQQRAVAQLRASERRFRALIEHNADGIALLDRQGVVQYVSPAAERILGFALVEFTAAEALTFVHPHDREDVRHAIAALNTGATTATIELRLRHRDSTWRWIEAVFSNLIAEPTVSAIVVNYRDITARRAADDELRQYANELVVLHRMERHARLQAETLRAANLAVTNSLTLETVLGAMFGALAHLAPYDLAQLILLDGDAVGAVYQACSSAYRTIAHLPVDAIDLDQLDPIDTSADPAAPADPTSIVVPIQVNNIRIGLCRLTAREGERFSAEHIAWIAAVAAQAAVALQNAQLFDAVREGRQRLEALSHKLIGAQEAERRHLARELHDDIGQVLVALQLNLRRAQDQAGATPIAPHLTDSVGLVERLIQQVRTLSRDLRPSLLDDLGLVPALEWHLKQLADRSGLALHLSAHLDDTPIAPELAISIFRIVQEALTNVLKHARAGRARVELRREGDEIRVSITDDGVGFDVEAARQRADGGASLGLISMQERARLANGCVEIISAPEAGACVRARFALDPHAAPPC